MNVKLNIGLRGRFRPQVIDAKTKKVLRDFGWTRNLITDQGLDRIALTSIAECMRYCAAGTDSTTPATTDTTLVSQVLSGAGFSGTYVAGENGTVRVGADVTHTRMFEFASPASSTIYREAGATWSNSAYTGGAKTSLFSRVLLNGTTGVTVDTTEQLRVTYELTVTYSPVTASNAKTGLMTHPSGNVDGDWALSMFTGKDGYQFVNSNGSTSSGSAPFEPSHNIGYMWISDTDKTLPVAAMWGQTYNSADHDFGKNVDTSPATTTISGVAMVGQSYSNGTFTRDHTATISASAGSKPIKAFGYGRVEYYNISTDLAMACVLDTEVTKSNLQKLTFTVTFTWNRV